MNMSKDHSPKRSGSAERLRNARTISTIEDNFGGPGERHGRSTSPSSRPSTVGRHSEERIRKRAAMQPPVDRTGLGSAGSVGSVRSSSNKRQRSNAGGDHNCNSITGVNESSGLPVSSYDVPNARLGSEVAMSHNTSALGSSQIAGCQGDFCHFNLLSLEDGDATATNKTLEKSGGMSNFRKKLVSGEGREDTFFDMSSFRSGAGSGADGVSNFGDANDMKSVASFTSKSTAAGGGRGGGGGLPQLAGAQSKPQFMKVAQRSIIHARQELPLVKLQLDRHRRGLTDPYVSEDNYQGLGMSGKLPAHYYKEVPVCMNCYKVYNIVDKARAKALRNIARRNDERKSIADESIASANDAGSHAYHPNKSFMSRMSDANSSAYGAVGGGGMPLEGSLLSLESAMQSDASARSTLQPAIDAIESLTKLDVAEIRLMSKPPAAVEVVMEAVMILLTGRPMPFTETRKMLAGGDSFLTMLKDFNLRELTRERLLRVESYVDNPLFRPENVAPISRCASKFCAWVHGIVQAARWEKGMAHKRIDVLKPKDGGLHSPGSSTKGRDLRPIRKGGAASLGPGGIGGGGCGISASAAAASEELSFVQKLQNIKQSKMKEPAHSHSGSPSSVSRGPDGKGSATQMHRSNSLSSSGTYARPAAGGDRGSISGGKTLRAISRSVDKHPAYGSGKALSEREEQSVDTLHSRRVGRFDPGPTPSMAASCLDDGDGLHKPSKKLSKRESKVVKASQKKATERLSSQSASEGGGGLLGNQMTFRCSDGITKIPYVILGKFSLADVIKCSFVVVHDFFDTCDATATLFKNIAMRHEGCQILCFNYPGQANTVWPRLSPVERERGAKEPMLNNDWIADRMHELLQHAENAGEILLSNPFHLVGIGNGACIAAAFCQRYSYHPLYVSSLRSLVSINGFLYPDAQLSSVLHSAYQVFESTPHSRPDIPVSYWSRFVFSDDYLTKINPNLALNIYTAVSNPITSEGRSKIAKGALQHLDLRGALSPDYAPTGTRATSFRSQVTDASAGRPPSQSSQFVPIQIPVILLQSTENSLVNASNVDSFLVGRHSKHLWSHMLNIPSDSLMNHAFETNAQWVGRMSTGPHDYAKYSILGKNGIRMLFDSLNNPRGAFSMWVRCGHAVQQEHKAAMLDLIDILACPTDEYAGLSSAIEGGGRFSHEGSISLLDDSSVSAHSGMTASATGTGMLLPAENEEISSLLEDKAPPKVGVLFKLQPPKKSDPSGARSAAAAAAARGTDGGKGGADGVGHSERESGEGDGEGAGTANRSTASSITSASASFSSVPARPRSPSAPPNPLVYGISERTIEVESVASDPNSINNPADAFDTEAEGLSAAVSPADSAADRKLALQREVIAEGEGEGEEDDRTAAAFAVAAAAPQFTKSASVKNKETDAKDEAGARESKEEERELKFDLAAPPVTSAVPILADPASTAWIARATGTAGAKNKDKRIAGGVGAQPYDTETTLQDARRPFVIPASNPRPGLPPARPNPVTINPSINVPAASTANGPALIKSIKEGREISNLSDGQQRREREWVAMVPDVSTALDLEAELARKKKEYLELEAEVKRRTQESEAQRALRIEQAQYQRREQFAKQDEELLATLQAELDVRQRERDFAERQRRLQTQAVEDALVREGLIEAYDSPIAASRQHLDSSADPFASETSSLTSAPFHTLGGGSSGGAGGSISRDGQLGLGPVPEMIPLRYDEPSDLPPALLEAQDVLSKLDRMRADEEEARKRGTMTMDDYEQVKRRMAERQLQRDQMLRHLSADEQKALFARNAIQIQRIARGVIGRRKALEAAELRELRLTQEKKALMIQAGVRGLFGRRRFAEYKRQYLLELMGTHSAIQIQKIARAFAGRKYTRKLRRLRNAVKIQRVFRGHLGRMAFNREKNRLEMLRRKQESAAKIQSIWRMKVAAEEFRSMRIHTLATIEIQRIYRGFIGRKAMARRRQWESTTPGPERIKLGLQFIEESKMAFERQQEEIDALHRAQERAEGRISHIHAELRDSEKELVVLERELQEIDQIERDLTALTHERSLLVDDVVDAVGMPRIAGKGKEGLVLGRESNKDNDPLLDRRRKAEAYALEMTIQIKRAEREKKRQELEIEFAAVFQEVERKKKALHRLEASLADMESTRERKDREFSRLQKNLMQLLLEQKTELDELREKGIELETATATSAAAAVATAQKAKEHEQRSGALFSQTEELMKFQFMSMSLSYFSSLNMLKSLRDMNADTTSAAISMSADAAATAASAAAAANLPDMKKLNMGNNDFMEASILKKKAEVESSEAAHAELQHSLAHPLPDSVRTWNISDVSRWLDSLFLGQYVPAFAEALIDGPFLMELREEDLVQVLGIKHKLHVRKIMLSREKLKPLTLKEQRQKEVVTQEDDADAVRRELGVPSVDTVFSQARNGRVKRVEESLNIGFPIDAEDERGNTLLLIAAQNSNKRLVEMLLVRGANINHQNAQGNTALHFALSFNPEGMLGEYLIERGADDTVENIDGLTPYDGVSK